MKDQHELIQGYRSLSQEEIDSINEVKFKADSVGALCNKLEMLAKDNPENIDPRWVAIAKTDLQKGFMSLVRAIAKPQSF